MLIREKKGLGFEIQNNVENPFILNKSKELTPSLYNIDEMGKDLLSDHKIISEEELKCEDMKGKDESLVKEMKDDLKYVTSLEDEFDEKCLILDIQKDFFKTQFESAISESYSHVYENEIFKQNSSLENENRYKKFDKDFQKIESMKKKKSDSQISSDFLQKSLYDSDASNVPSESGKKMILFRNETSSFESKIKELKTLDRKIQDSKAEKDQFLKQIASLESKLASQDLISNQKEYNELSISYNALKAKFDVLNREKGKSLMSNFSTLKVSVSPKIYTGESSKSFPKRVSQFTTYSLQKDRKFSKKP
ncbi:hypothetical protein Tco_1185384 [Tanacetum coccineum]